VLNAKQLGYYVYMNRPLADLGEEQWDAVETMVAEVSRNAIGVIEACLEINATDDRNANLLLVQAILHQYREEPEEARSSLEYIITHFPDSDAAKKAWEIVQTEFS
jgi:hypothetical protein